MRVAVLLPNWVGDTCMATPTLRAIAQLPSVEELVLVGKPGPLSVLEGLPFAQHQIAYKPRSRSPELLSRRGVAAELRRRHLDAIVLLPNSLSTGLIAWLSRIPRRIGYVKNGRGLLLTDAIAIRTTLERPNADGSLTSRTSINWSRQPAIDYYLHLAEQLGASSSDRRMELAVRETDRVEAERLLDRVGFDRTRKLILINNASGSSPARLWPQEYAVQLAKRLAESGHQVLFHAGPADRQVSLAYATAANHSAVQSMGVAEQLPLGLSRGLIAAADLLVTTDSGPRHIGVALNKRVLTMFGPTDTAPTRTYNVPEIALETQQSCRPCGKDICPLQHHKCLRDLGPDTLVKAIATLLADSPLSLQPSTTTSAA
ncbi:lipopolysaccharide heptosyltransferase II [Pirellula sp. SH-Sr6A]|uniref:lipopolysaccharide heptosyltransferase II n=1 Tax=Pirellula sp. SH-Sr6A TaxID=1632865 RepID=UPI002110FC7B|nr:lipopolysaccharide heptosyltransferase II [Pirellula sp. SH-Sr6A]